MKQAGLALPDPTKTAPDNWTASCVTTGHFVAVLRDQEEFRTADQFACLQERRAAVQKRIVLLTEEAPGRDPNGGPVPRLTSTAASDKDRDMADGAAVHGKWDGTGCAGMARFPVPAIWPRPPRPPSLLRRLQHHFLHLPCP